MSFPPLRVVTGPAVPLLLPHVDTDVIIRVDRMTSTTPADLAPWAFETLRYRDGRPDPGCVLNSVHGPILLAGENFGCGSSREPAVWALQGLGFRCVIAPSFGDIFRLNCQQNGVLAVALPAADIAAAAGGGPVTVDLERRQVRAGGRVWDFDFPAVQQRCLLEGVDDLELILRELPAIEAWRERDRQRRPWAWQPLERVDR